MNPEVIKHLVSMRHSPLHNYIVPGLTSWLILDHGDAGKVRMFECTREQHEFITPHSHRFDFSACVLEGWVENTLWVKTDDGGDMYRETQSVYQGRPGSYTDNRLGEFGFITDTVMHVAGDWYNMHFTEIHSIKFGKGAKVLFFEGPKKTNSSSVLEPFVDGEHLPTMRTESWMFRKGAA